jgi:hypothetical protein
MITFNCNQDDCANKGVDYNFLGNPVTAECGGCKSLLIGTNERPDPEELPPFLGSIEKE